MPAEVGVRVGGHDAGLTTPPHTVSPPPSPPRLSIPHLICQLSALPDARFGGRDENCGLDISTPMGEAMFAIIAAMAQLERRVIQERVIAGIEHAKAKGTKSGAAIGRPRVVFDRANVAELRDA